MGSKWTCVRRALLKPCSWSRYALTFFKILVSTFLKYYSRAKRSVTPVTGDAEYAGVAEPRSRMGLGPPTFTSYIYVLKSM